jgi:hypothetical protein
LFNLDLTQILDIHRYPIQSKAFHIAQNGSFQVGNNGVALGQRDIISTKRYTVTKAYQNEAFLWKISVLGLKKPTVGAGTFVLVHAGILQILHAGNVLRHGGMLKKKIPMTLAHAGFYNLPCQKCRTRSKYLIFCTPMQVNFGLEVYDSRYRTGSVLLRT